MTAGAWEKKWRGERQHRLAIVEFGHLLHGNGFVAATDGICPFALDANRLLVTPTYMSKGRMKPSDLVIVDLNGNQLAGKRNVSSENRHAPADLSAASRCTRDRTCASADGHRVCRLRTRPEPSP